MNKNESLPNLPLAVHPLTLLSHLVLVGMLLLGGCIGTKSRVRMASPEGVEIPFTELKMKDLAPEILANRGLVGCRLEDLRPFGWKEVNAGRVDIRTPEAYAIQTGSLYQEGYRDYLQNRAEFPDTHQNIPVMKYEEFLANCNLFPDIDFSKHTLLGYQASGTGCSVTFEKHVYRDDINKTILFELTVIEQGTCEKAFQDRNLILVSRIPADYNVTFLRAGREE